MMKTKYEDRAAINQVIGCLYRNPAFFNQDDKYKFKKEDFVSAFHQITFSCLYNLWNSGVKSFNFETLSDYFNSRPKAKAEFEVNKGYEYLLRVGETAQIDSFNYYYNRMVKFSMFRGFESIGMGLDWLYNPDLALTDSKKLQEQEEFIDVHSLGELSDLIVDKIDEIKMKYADGDTDIETQNIGDDIFDLIEELKESPDLGLPMYGPYMNTVTRGMRYGKVYMRSAPSNVGKTRAMIGDACYAACSQMYDLKENRWIAIGACQSSLLITTEQDIKEVQLMCLGFISGVNENHIALNEYYIGEEERVQKAAQILKSSKLHFVELPDFTTERIEQTIKLNIRENDTRLIFFDYVHTSMGILSEITQKSGGVKMREDQILLLLMIKLKEIATTYDVFIMTASQLNGDWKTTEVLDMNCLRGAKALADKIDWGSIMVDITSEDLEKIQPIMRKGNFPNPPNIKMSIYKNRANEHKNEYMFIYADKGICRYECLFMTNFRYELVNAPDIKIKVEEESIF